MNTLQQIEKRKLEISEEIKTRGETITSEEIKALSTEIENLETEKRTLVETEKNRKDLLERIANNNNIDTKILSRNSFLNSGNPSEIKPDNSVNSNDFEYRKAFKNFVLRGTPIPVQFRADSVTKTSDIESVIPNVIVDKIIQKIESVGMILPLITRTSYKGGASIPTSSLKPVATWVAEGAGSDKQNLATGNINFQYFKLRCAVAITLESDTVSLEIFENMLIQNIIEAMTKALEIAVINGDGNGKPTGILAATVPENQDIFTLENSADFETLINAEAAVPIEYDNSAVWFMSKKTFNSFASITDSSGQLVIKNGYDINGKPERSLLGRHVVLTPYLPSLSASTPASTVFAFILNPKDYVLNTNYQLTLKKYEDNDTDDIINKAVMLVDGKLTDNSSLVTVSTPASA